MENKEKTNQQQPIEEIIPIGKNTVKVGDIILESEIPINILCDIVIQLLQQDEIKNYLKNFNNEKILSGIKPSGIE